jgi:hypothetical protein
MAIKTSILTRNVYLNIPIKIVTQAIKWTHRNFKPY